MPWSISSCSAAIWNARYRARTDREAVGRLTQLAADALTGVREPAETTEDSEHLLLQVWRARRPPKICNEILALAPQCVEPRVRSGLAAGARRIRTFGPTGRSRWPSVRKRPLSLYAAIYSTRLTLTMPPRLAMARARSLAARSTSGDGSGQIPMPARAQTDPIESLAGIGLALGAGGSGLAGDPRAMQE